MTRADNTRRGRRTSATGAAIVAATEVAVEADAAAIAREAEAATPDTAAGAAIVAAAEVAGEVAAGEAMATAERVAEVIAPAEPVAAPAFDPLSEPSSEPAAPMPIDPIPTRKHDMSDPSQSPAGVPGAEENIDLLSGAFSVADVANALRHAQQVDPAHIEQLRAAFLMLDTEAAQAAASSAATPGLDGLFGNVSTTGRIAAAPLGSVRRFRLVSPIIDGRGGVPAGEWVTADRDYHALLRTGLSVDVDWDGGLPL